MCKLYPPALRTAFACFLFISTRLTAQTDGDFCGSDLVRLLAMQHPEWQQRHNLQEQQAYEYFKNKSAQSSGKPGVQVVTLPVVVHIIHDNGAENIPDAKVLAGIQQLNEAFANSNYYDQGTGANTMIQFCLAKRSADDMASTGITRDQSPLTQMTIELDDIAVKDINRWPPTEYINIWVVREICRLGVGCSVAGYAYLPSSHGGPEDGIMIEAKWLGSSPGNTGVLVHEMGHYLGLYHTFEGGCQNDDCLINGDRVCDTPPDQSTLWVPCDQVVNSCNTDAQSGFPSDQPDMILNFMDYTDFYCFNDFTPGQSDRMHWHIENVRQSLLESKGCENPCPALVTAFFTASANAINVGQTVNFTNGSINASGYTWLIDGVPFSTSANASYTFASTGSFTIGLVADPSDPVLCYSAEYQVVVNVSCPVIADFTVDNINPAVGEAVTVTNQSQNATQYEWFLNGVSQGVSFTGFIPNTVGVYTIRLVATNGFCEKTKSIYLSVRDSCSNVTFQKTWGDAADNRGTYTVLLADGNILAGGTTVLPNNGTDIYLLKTAPDGTTLMQKRYGGPGTDGIRQLLALPDGGWVLVGDNPGPNGPRPLVARFSSGGALLWQKTMNTVDVVNVYTDIIMTQDGNLLLGGAIHTNSTIAFTCILTKLDLNGNTIWSKLYDGSYVDFIQGICELPDGDIAAAGFTNSFGLNLFSIHDGMAMRFSSTGALKWVNAYGSSENEWLTEIFPTSDGGIMTIGATSGWNGPAGGIYMDDGWMIKLGPGGAMEWSEVMRSDQNIDFGVVGAKQTGDGGFVFAGNDLATIGSNTPLLLKTDPMGNIEWSRIYGGQGAGRIVSVDIAPGGYIFAGYTTSAGSPDVWLLKTDEAGFAGLCAEVPHTITTESVQPVLTPGIIATLPSPPLFNATLTVGDLSFSENAPCAPNCTNDTDCESTWIKSAGVANSTEEGSTNLLRASDGNFYISAYRGDSTLLLKMTPDGLVIWTRAFKFTSGTDERVSQLIEDSDGKLAGSGVFSNGGLLIGFTFRYDPSSDQVLWAFENPSSPQTFYFTMMEKTPGGNYLAFNSYHQSPAPGSFDDAHLVEIDRNTGQYTGLKTAFSYGSSEGVLEAQMYNGKIYAAGRYTYGNVLSGMRGSLGCFDVQGNEIWSRMAFFDPQAQARNYATDFVIDAGHMITIYYGDFDGIDGFSDQFAVSKTDLNGNMVWSKIYTIAGFPMVYAKSIIAIADGYIILATNQALDQPLSVYLIRIDKNGNLVWARDYRDMTVFRGEKFLVASGDYLYFAAGYNASDIALAKVNLSDGLVGSNCALPLDLTVTVQDFSTLLSPVNLIKYPSPIIQSSRFVTPQSLNLATEDICKQNCAQEICNNGIDDDGDGLFDCLDPDCDCQACDGSQARFWYFGDGAALDFSSDPPTVLANGATFSREASAVATDILGNLLFYTDAQTLYARNHQPMPNGSNLDGHASTTQTLILPEPESPGRFYVFTPNSFDNLPSGKGLSYSVVDMSLQSSLGDVPAGQKNISLVPQNLFTEKISATRHCNGKDWWILTKERQNNRFRAYPLMAGGLGTAATSDIGTAGSTALPNTIGCLKFSPNGEKVVNTLFSTGGFEIFDFDKSTGLLSNAVTITDPSFGGAYGVEFSPDGKLLYLTNLIAPSHIWQFDLTAGDGTAIRASALVLAEFPDEYRFGQLQRAPNSKIYVTNTFPLQFTPGLGIIHKPNIAGTGCQYQQGGLNLTPGSANLGLPSFPQDFLVKSIQADITGPDTVCQLPASIVYQLKTDNPCALDSVAWSLSGPGTIVSQSNDQIEIAFAQPGSVTLIATAFTECSTGADTMSVYLVDDQTPVLDLGPDILVCDNGVKVLHAGPGFQKYRWSDGTTDSTTTAYLFGKYWVDVWDLCGNKQTDTVTISLLPPTALDLGPDQVVCAGTSVGFVRPVIFNSWMWLPPDGLDCDTCKTIHAAVTAPMTYIVIAQSGEGCLSADTITLQIVTDTIFASFDTVVCRNETLFILGHELGADTVAVVSIITAGGCDSVLTVTVTGLDTAYSEVELFVCQGSTLDVYGIPVSTDTVLQFIFATANGCDSIVRVEVSVLDTILNQVTLQACPGGFALYNGEEIAVGETQVFQFPVGQAFCDSTVVVQVVPFAVPFIQLPGIDTILIGDSVLLNPTYSGNPPFSWQWTPLAPPDWLSCYDCPSPLANPLVTMSYQVSITDGNGCTAADSSAIVVLPCGLPYVPNIFSPNDDGLNDRFYPLGPDCISKVRYLRIYDRWGELIFERTDFPLNIESLGWDGRYRGKPLGPSVLVWIAEFEFPDRTTVKKYGDVTLIR